MSEQPPTAADRAAMIDAGQLPPAPWSDEERVRLSQLYPGMRYDEGRATPGHRGSLRINGVPITGVQSAAFTPALDPWVDDVALEFAPMPEITIEGAADPFDLTVTCLLCGMPQWIFSMRPGCKFVSRPDAEPVAVDVCKDCAVALEKMAADEAAEQEGDDA